MRFLLMLTVLLISSCHPNENETPPIQSKVILETSTSWDGTPLEYPEGEAKITGMIIEIVPGAETGWHLHPVPNFGILLEGVLEVSLEDGTTKRIEAGEAVSEVVNTWHIGRSVGDEPAKIVVFYAGATGKDLTVMKEE